MRNILEYENAWVVKGENYLLGLPLLTLSYASYPKDVFIAHPDANKVDYPALPFINRNRDYEKLNNGYAWYLMTGDKLEKPNVAILDLETTGLVPEKDIILMVGLDFEEETIILNGEEADTVPLTVMLLENENPDIIAGHNISGFDMPFFRKRYRYLQNMGILDEDPPITVKKRKFRVGMEVDDIDVYYFGFSLCADTRLLLRRYDNMTGMKLRSMSLKFAVKEMGLSSREWETFMQQKTEEDKMRYLLNDLSDTRKMFYAVTDWWFLLSAFIPMCLEDLYTGTGTLVDIALQKYLCVYPLPKRQTETRPYEGAKVDIQFVGYVDKVYALDVVSMYPSIIRQFIKPHYDTKGVFSQLVGAFMDLRVALKKQGNPIHKALKIVINSFYGYLASSFSFADVKEAEKITFIGRELITELTEKVSQFATVCELDTDGIYFTCDGTKMPLVSSIIDEFAQRGFALELSEYDAGLFVKKKNYALWNGENIIFKGNSLQSRRDDDIMFALVRDIVNAYRTADPRKAIQETWQKCMNEYIYHRTQNLTGEWKRLHYLPMERDENPSNATKAERLLRLQKVFGRFDTLPECKEIANKPKNIVLGELFGQQTLIGGD